MTEGVRSQTANLVKLMSEYWKSTVNSTNVETLDIIALTAFQPKYWCKHCKAFVRDTKLEKTNHEATAKHQGNLQRFLRELHKSGEREAREKQKAKDEVDRLNGVVSRPRIGDAYMDRKPAIPGPSATTRQVTPAERKRQLQQLADMGVAVPDDFRGEMAMAGEWQTTSQTVIYDNPSEEKVKKEEEIEEPKAGVLNFGVRKRKVERLDEEEGSTAYGSRPSWGSVRRAYPGSAGDADNLDALLKNSTGAAIIRKNLNISGPTASAGDMAPGGQTANPGIAVDTTKINQEQALESGDNLDNVAPLEKETSIKIKEEDDKPNTGIMFKKRKPKAIRSN